MSSTQFSVCIPRIFNNIPNKKIIGTFENLDLGKVSSMDIVYKTGVDGSTYKMAFVHFSKWYNNTIATLFRERVENPELQAKLVYDDPWYWIVLPNNSSVKNSVPKPMSPFETALSKYVNLEECFNRINQLDEEVSCIYEKLFGREFIPRCNQRHVETSDDIELGNTSPMSISELDEDDYDDEDNTPLHLSPESSKGYTCQIYPESSYYDEAMSVTTDTEFYDLEQGGSPDSYSIIIPTQTTSHRQWITENMCGNA